MSPASIVPVIDHGPKPLELPDWTSISMSSFESGTSKVYARTLPRVYVCEVRHALPSCRQRNRYRLTAGAPPGTVPAAQVASTSSDCVDVAAGVGPRFGSSGGPVMSAATMAPVSDHGPEAVAVAYLHLHLDGVVVIRDGDHDHAHVFQGGRSGSAPILASLPPSKPVAMDHRRANANRPSRPGRVHPQRYSRGRGRRRSSVGNGRD